MVKGAYYNEFDPKAAAWIRELIKRGLVADGEVDERDLWDVRPDDIRDFTQVHLCAGIAVWSYALRRAGWDDSRPVWTSSFPCQPFSAAGKGAGFADERHLWPAGQYLIEQCRPRTLFGEQVASKDAEPWLDAVQADLEAMGYAFGACAFPSAGIGAPHIRDRAYWVADAGGERRGGEHSRERQGQGGRQSADHPEIARSGEDGLVADADHARPQGWLERGVGPGQRAAGAGGVAGGLADADGGDASAERQQRGGQQRQQPQDGGAGELDDAERESSGRGRLQRSDEGGEATRAGAPAEPVGAGALRDLEQPGPVNGRWAASDWLYCRDGKWRPVEPGTFPLAHGAPARVGRLRGYGNAINAEAAIAWIESYLEAIGERAYATGGAEEASAVQA